MFTVVNGRVIVVQKCWQRDGAGEYGYISNSEASKHISGLSHWVTDIERLSRDFKRCLSYSLKCVKLCEITRKNGSTVHLLKVNRIEVICHIFTSYPSLRSHSVSKISLFDAALVIRLLPVK